MSDFNREFRYIVIKLKDAEMSLDCDDLKNLNMIIDKISEHRKEVDKGDLECVVVESDWEIYEKVWSLINIMHINDVS